jgi:dethiobiotin synthetase
VSTLVITGAGTEIGKTYIACALIAAARRVGVTVDAFKPVVSGYDDAGAAESDPVRLLAALGRSVTPEAIAAIAPWRYRAPLAANLAARAEGAVIDFAEVVAACRRGASQDLLLLEGAGGVMSPLTDRETFLDLFAALGAPLVMVGGAYLGAISHMLTAVVAVRARGLQIAGAIINQGEASAEALAQTLQTLRALDPGSPYEPLAHGAALDHWGARLASLA